MSESKEHSFSQLGLPKELIKSLEDQKLPTPYPIQIQGIPVVLKGQDVLGIAQTGSGKTISYVLPILANLQGNINPKNRFVNVLVLVPTRELAVQIEKVFQRFEHTLSGDIKTRAVFGGVSINPQMKSMSGVNILVATPGRLLDLLDSNALHLSEIDTLVLDEADKMLNLGFKEELDRILGLLPKKRQNLLYSATLSEDVNNIGRNFLHEPTIIKIESKKENIDLINQTAYSVENEKKGPLLRYLIKKSDGKQFLVFTSSVRSADVVESKLLKNGIDAMSIHSKKSQGARMDALDRLKRGDIQVLVATDLLSRGIDIQFLPYVVNYELPRSPKDYIHRIGRTGRAENRGDAISFVTKEDRHHFKVIQKKAGTWVDLIESEKMDF